MPRRKSIDKKAVKQKILETDVETKIANLDKQTKKKYQLAADEFEETFGLLNVEDEYEEMVGTSRRRHAARQAEKKAAEKAEAAAARRAEKARLLKIKQDNNARDKRAQDREKAKKKQERGRKRNEAKKKATEQERKDIRREMNKDKPLRQRSYSNRKYEEPAGRNPNRKIGGRGKKHKTQLVDAQLNKNIDTINAQKAKSSSRNRGLSKADEKKISGCVALGVKVDKKKGPPMYPNHECKRCCDSKLKGQNWSICKNRCDNKYPPNNTTVNPMIATRRRKLQEDKYDNDAYEFGEDDENTHELSKVEEYEETARGGKLKINGRTYKPADFRNGKNQKLLQQIENKFYSTKQTPTVKEQEEPSKKIYQNLKF